MALPTPPGANKVHGADLPCTNTHPQPRRAAKVAVLVRRGIQSPGLQRGPDGACRGTCQPVRARLAPAKTALIRKVGR